MLRVLVVDDTVDIRFLLRLALEIDGRFEIAGEAGDGWEAIEAAARLRPDVVLLDLAMPVMDGLEALPEIHAKSPQSKIVILSGFDAGEMSTEALRLGASSYLEKVSIADRLVPHILQHFPAYHREVTTIVPARLGSPSVADEPGAAPEPTEDHDLTKKWVSALAHELDNPVTILQGLAMILQHSPTDSISPDVIEQSVAAIARSAKHLGALVESFSELRNLEIEALDLALEATDLSQLVSETIGGMAEMTNIHTVTVDVVEGVFASIDPTRVRQVLINLLTNATKFAPAGTDIEVSMIIAGDNTEISVRDHGPGIPTDKLSELFRKFSRLDPTVQGTGIGLFLSRGIARAHSGDLILAESAAPGCRFILRLPVLHVSPS